MGHKGLADNILQLLLNKIESECAHMSQRITPVSPFRRIAIDKYTTFQWKDFIEHLSETAPTLFFILSSVVAHSDRRNKKKLNTSHYPGLCMAIAVLLKERNREMCGVQSLVSLLIYSSHVDKQVGITTCILLQQAQRSWYVQLINFMTPAFSNRYTLD